MDKNREMTRLSIYTDKNLIKELQMLADKERRSLSFLVSDILQRVVNRKNAKKSSI